MGYFFLGNPHKTEYEDIDEDFNIVDEEFLDDQDSLDYDDDDDDDYVTEDEPEDDDIDTDGDDCLMFDDVLDYWETYYSDESSLDTDVPGPPNAAIEDSDDDNVQMQETTASTEKPSVESKVTDDLPTVHRNIENNPET